MEFQNDHSSKVIADRLSLAIELAMSWSAKKDLRLVSCCQWMTLIQGINVISHQMARLSSDSLGAFRLCPPPPL